MNKILDATLVLIEEVGLSAITTNHIAAKSGIKVGSIYRFYPNKEAIFISLTQRWHTNIMLGIEKHRKDQTKRLNFNQYVKSLFNEILETEYEQSAAYRELYFTAGTIPVLLEEMQRHNLKVATYVANHYCETSSRNKSHVIDFCLFLQVSVATALRHTASLNGIKRKRQISWTYGMIDGAIHQFELVEGK